VTDKQTDFLVANATLTVTMLWRQKINVIKIIK